MASNEVEIFVLRRFDPSFRSVYDKVRAGAIGHVNLIKCTSRDSPLPSLAYLKVFPGEVRCFLS